MGSQQSVVDAIVAAASGAGDVSARKMFGEYGLYCDGKLVALICDDRLFVKPTDAGRRIAGRFDEVSPYEGAKPCFVIPPDYWYDSIWLSELIRATVVGLPTLKPKRISK